ncbi:MAG TPA: sulfatase [Planctomycetota bacterium]|nr:sulfatase [Planctomycetota bacterium]
MSENRVRRGGAFVTLRAALNAGLGAGALLGLADGIVAGLRTDLSGAWNWIGCLGGAVVLYGVFWSAVLLVLSPLAHLLLRHRPLAERVRALFLLALSLGVFLELYWWSREWLFWGLPATHPKRLAVAAALLPLAGLLAWAATALGRKLSRSALWAAAATVPILWLLGLAYLSGARAETEELGAPNARTVGRANVLIFVVDALRSDVLGCYGSQRIRTPRIDELAARGVLFENALVQAPFTWSSFGSLLTGKYPRRHGLVKMAPGVRMWPNVTLPWHLKSAALAESGNLREGDYYGAAFMTGTLSHGSGLTRGFDAYYEAMVGHGLVLAGQPWSVFRSELVLSIVRAKLEQRLHDDPVARVARSWLADNARKRFVAMVHFYTTHTPYDPPERFRKMYCDPAYDGPIRSFYADARIAIEEGRFRPNDADRRQIADLYAGGVTQADEMIGSVLDELAREKLPDGTSVLDHTLVIVTSDHGEELGDHDLWEHNFMYQTNLRVPLVMALPGALPPGRRVAALVEQVDVVPTVCELLRVAPPHEQGGVDEAGRDRGAIDGVSLVALARGEVAGVKEFSFAENGVYLAVQDERWKLVVPSQALSEEGWRAMQAGELERAQLYDLATDPGEHANLLEEAPGEAERLLAALREFDRSMPIPRQAIVESARDRDETARRLQGLGYAGGVGQGAGDPSPRSQ